MKKILLPLICVLFVATSCKKKNDVTPANTITATVDGTNYTFNTNLKANKEFVPLGTGSNTLFIQGYSAADNTASVISFSVSSTDANAIAKGTYTSASANSTPAVYAQIVFNGPANNPSQQPFTSDPFGVQPMSITITSITSTNVQGTFSGILPHSNNDGTARAVTNGKFNVNITN